MANQQQIADHIDLSARRVRELIREGILPASKGNGGLDIDACRVAYIRHLRGIASGQVKIQEEDLQLNQERAKLAVKQIKKLQRENAIATEIRGRKLFLFYLRR